ncbi:MAG TPA: ABC transporter permease [Candidatus Omnitrophota bacterium]|nr:ABC transporter permease [Candidatus Omnitrophota bacterium]HQQ06371.1 ABC transporter permease [Candidatus Omnitrophota bacterium]
MRVYDILRELVIKELKVRYGRPMLGFLWAIVVPLSTALILYAVFNIILKISITEAPFILYLMTGVFPWRFFQDSVMGSVTSLVDNRNILKESRVPFYAVPVAAVLVSMITFIPALAVVIVSAAIIMHGIPVWLILLPAVLCIHFCMAAGVAVLVSAVYVFWRDMKYAVETALLIIFYISPVFYSVSMIQGVVPGGLFRLYLASPFVSIMQGYRVCLLKGFAAEAAAADWFACAAVQMLVFLIVLTAAAAGMYAANRRRLAEHLSY